MANYPDPTRLGYLHSDPGDHDDGGLCASKSSGRIRGWDDLIDQHTRAFELLTEAALAEGAGWGLTRPILFEAHHICELVLKRVLARERRQSFSHRLADLWTEALPLLPKRVGVRDREWIGTFVHEMARLTSDGSDGRFPDARIDVGAQWCCLNVSELQLSVGTLLLIVRGGRRVQGGVAEPPSLQP